MDIEGIMSMQRTPLRFVLATLAVLCFGTGYAMAQSDEAAQMGLAWETKATRAGIHVLDNPRPRLKSPASRLTVPAPAAVKIVTVVKNGKKTAMPPKRTFENVSAFGQEHGMVLSGGTKNENARRFSPSLQDNSAIIGGLRPYESSFGAAYKKSSAPRRRLSSP